MDGIFVSDSEVIRREFVIDINTISYIHRRLLMCREVSNDVVQDNGPLKTALCIKHEFFCSVREEGTSFGKDR